MALTLRLFGIVRMGKGVSKPCYRFLTFTTTRRGTIVPFKLADIGEGIREVTLKEWFVSPGDKVAQFDQICEVQSDKASVTITSRYDGHVRTLHHKIDDTAMVGDPLVDIELEDDVSGIAGDDRIPVEAVDALSATTSPNVATDTARTIGDAKNVDRSTKKILTTPSVRRIAWENNVDLKNVAATGRNGRVLKEDMLAHLEKNLKDEKQSDDCRSTRGNDDDDVVGRDGQIVHLKGYQKYMWKSMTQSLSIPHVVYSDECNVTKLGIYRSEVKNYLKEQGVALTFMPFFIKAASKALSEFPRLNSWVDEDSQCLKMFRQHNISVAMDTPEGLVVPNIKNVQNLSVVEIAKELNRLQEIGKKSSFGLNDITGGTFSLSNIGVIGGTYMKPVILPPQILIGTVGKIQKLPRFDETENIVAADILSVSWAADHRVVDGVTMAKFSNRWRYYVENPSILIL